MDDELRAAFEATDYRVRLACGGWATIRIGAELPDTLRRLVDAHSWGFITAWNPLAQPRSRQRNRVAQRQLLDSLRSLPATIAVHPASGAGTNWSEPSLFVIGPDAHTLDTLARQYEQRAYVHGHANGSAGLRWIE